MFLQISKKIDNPLERFFTGGKKIRKKKNNTTNEERTKLLDQQRFKIEYDNFMPMKMKSETKWANS